MIKGKLLVWGRFIACILFLPFASEHRSTPVMTLLIRNVCLHFLGTLIAVESPHICFQRLIVGFSSEK